MTNADDTAAATATWTKTPDYRFLARGGRRLEPTGLWSLRVNGKEIAHNLLEADADAILRLKDEAREAQQLRAALREVERIDTYWRDGGSGNEYGPCAEVALAALEASTTATGGAP